MSDAGKEARTRTISWEDPRALAEAGRGLSGLEYLRKIVAGELPRPPIGALMKVNYICPMTAETGRVRCEAKVIHVGGRTASAEGRVVDESGKLYAHGTTTCIILRS